MNGVDCPMRALESMQEQQNWKRNDDITENESDRRFLKFLSEWALWAREAVSTSKLLAILLRNFSNARFHSFHRVQYAH